MENNFNEEDKKKVVQFLNMVASKAEFKMNTKEVIEYFKLLSHMQQTIIPKLEANIFEIKSIREHKED